MNGVFNYQQLKQVRLQLGATQTEMANRLGCARTTYADYENGRIQPPADKIQAMCEVLGMVYGEFIVPTGAMGDYAHPSKIKQRISDADKALLLNKLAKKQALVQDLKTMHEIAKNSTLRAKEKAMLTATLECLIANNAYTDYERDVLRHMEKNKK